MGELIRLENISKTYNQNKVLDQISLTINRQQVIAFLGGNGVGKSTLLRMIAGIESPSSGKIIYQKKNLTIGYVPERFPKDIRFTPSEYLTYIGKINGMGEAPRKDSIETLLHRFRLEEFDDKRMMNLSKGNIQKVGIIQAILQKPELLILDEPTSGLDSGAQQALTQVIQELKEAGTTILLTYHETNSLEKLIDTTYYVHNGTISKGQLIKNEPIKRLEVEKVDESLITKWNEVLAIERKNGRILLHVHEKDSDQVLYRILQLKGSIRRVETVHSFQNRTKDDQEGFA